MSRNGRSTTKASAAKPKSRAPLRARVESDAARIKRQLAFLKRLQREKEQRWASLTEAERREITAKWARVMKNINETRGYRRVFVE